MLITVVLGLKSCYSCYITTPFSKKIMTRSWLQVSAERPDDHVQRDGQQGKAEVVEASGRSRLMVFTLEISASKNVDKKTLFDKGHIKKSEFYTLYDTSNVLYIQYT